MIPGLFFTWSFTVGILTINSLRSPVPPGGGLPPLWLPGMIVSELAPWIALANPAVAVAFLVAGGLRHPVGWSGLVLAMLAEAGLLLLVGRTLRSVHQAGERPRLGRLLAVRTPVPGGRTPVLEQPYRDGLTLDRYGVGSGDSPVLVYVHPGSWMRGRPGRQALALFDTLVERGWVVLDIRYPLSPVATFPDHLVGVRGAIAWVRDQADDLGIDPRRVAVAGGSAGAHLAALAALTWDHEDLPPPAVETRVAACIGLYGIYDLLVRNGTRYDWPFIARHVLKARPDEAPELYRLASPIDMVRPDAPPFLVVHGSHDSLVLPAESKHFVTALTDAGADARYHEVHGAQHGFDAVASYRTRAVSRLVARFLEEAMPPVGNEG